MKKRIVFRYVRMDDIVQFALATLRERSPVGSGSDPHPGLYRDAHTVFLNGQSVRDVSAFKSGDEIEISNPEPYARKIEVGKIRTTLPPHVYEETVPILRAKYGEQAKITFDYKPVRYSYTRKKHYGYLARQPVITIRELR